MTFTEVTNGTVQVHSSHKHQHGSSMRITHDLIDQLP